MLPCLRCPCLLLQINEVLFFAFQAYGPDAYEKSMPLFEASLKQALEAAVAQGFKAQASAYGGLPQGGRSACCALIACVGGAWKLRNAHAGCLADPPPAPSSGPSPRRLACR